MGLSDGAIWKGCAIPCLLVTSLGFTAGCRMPKIVSGSRSRAGAKHWKEVVEKLRTEIPALAEHFSLLDEKLELKGFEKQYVKAYAIG
jgi:hypothetical protein